MTHPVHLFRYFRLVGAVLALSTIVLATSGTPVRPGVGVARAADGFEACFVNLAPKTLDRDRSEVLDTDCFTDPEDASVFAASLDSQDDVYVLFTIWANSAFGGSSYEWYSTTGCAGDYGYDDFNVIGWNDQAGSARSSCGREVKLWEHTYQAGASLQINGYQSSLGVLDDESSSWDTVN